MSVYANTHALKCDYPGCPLVFSKSATTVDDLEKLALAAGWIRLADRHFCPECKKRTDGSGDFPAPTVLGELQDTKAKLVALHEAMTQAGWTKGATPGNIAALIKFRQDSQAQDSAISATLENTRLSFASGEDVTSRVVRLAVAYKSLLTKHEHLEGTLKTMRATLDAVTGVVLPYQEAAENIVARLRAAEARLAK